MLKPSDGFNTVQRERPHRPPVKKWLPYLHLNSRTVVLNLWYSIVVRETFLGGTQWWILGEVNEAVASGLPSKILQIVSFCYIRFFRDHYEVGTKSGK